MLTMVVVFALLFWTARKQGRTEAWALLALAGPLGIIALLILWTKPTNIWGQLTRWTFFALLAWIGFSVIQVLRDYSNEDALQYRRAAIAAEKAGHYRQAKVGEYSCPKCNYVFDGKPQDDVFALGHTLTCPGCGEKLHNTATAK